MTPEQWGILVGVLLVLLGAAWYSTFLAKRLDRLHWRVLSTRDALDKLAVRRAAETKMLAASGLLDDVAAQRIDHAAGQALIGEEVLFVRDHLDRRRDGLRGANVDEESVAERNERESALTRALRETLTPQVRLHIGEDPQGRELLETLDMTCYRVQLARSMHNLDVTQVRHLREKAWVRLFRLYGRAATPSTIDFDDATDPVAAN